MTIEIGSLNADGIKHPEYSALLEPLDPREPLNLTASFYAAFGKISDMGYRTTKGDKLVCDETLFLGWISANGDIGYGEEVVPDWHAYDETRLFEAELIVAGKRADNPRRIRFEIPGIPRSGITLSTPDYKAEDLDLTIFYRQESIDISLNDLIIRNSITENRQYTTIKCLKRTRGFQRDITYQYMDKKWTRLILAQGALVDLDYYNKVAMLWHDISELSRAKVIGSQVRQILINKVRDRVMSIKDLLKAGSLKKDEAETFGDWVNDAIPDKFSLLSNILSLTNMNPKDIARVIQAVQSGSERIPRPMGQLKASFKIAKSSKSKQTKFMPPILGQSDEGHAGGLRSVWRGESQAFSKERGPDFILLEDALARLVYPTLMGISLLLKNGIDFRQIQK